MKAGAAGAQRRVQGWAVGASAILNTVCTPSDAVVSCAVVFGGGMVLIVCPAPRGRGFWGGNSPHGLPKPLGNVLFGGESGTAVPLRTGGEPPPPPHTHLPKMQRPPPARSPLSDQCTDK